MGGKIFPKILGKSTSPGPSTLAIKQSGGLGLGGPSGGLQPCTVPWLGEDYNLTFSVVVSLHILYNFIYVYVCMHIFVCFSTYFWICSYKIDSLIRGGRRRRPPPISLSISYEKNPIYRKTQKYAYTHKHI